MNMQVIYLDEKFDLNAVFDELLWFILLNRIEAVDLGYDQLLLQESIWRRL